MGTRIRRGIFVLSVFFLIIFPKPLLAAGGTISVVPESSKLNTGDEINLSIKADGGGTAFNAAKAYVSVSQNFTVEDLTFGDCGFAFVVTPTVNAQAFTGVILGDSSTQCTVYTLKLKAIEQGAGFVLVSDGSMKSYKRAQEILASVKGASFTITGPTQAGLQPSPTNAPLTLSDGIMLYTLTLNFPNPDNLPASSVKLVLDPDSPTKVLAQPTLVQGEQATLRASFENVAQGVHTISIEKGNKELSRQVLNIQGQNRNITVGIVPIKKPELFGIPLIATILIVLLSVFVIGVLSYRRFKAQSTEISP